MRGAAVGGNAVDSDRERMAAGHAGARAAVVERSFKAPHHVLSVDGVDPFEGSGLDHVERSAGELFRGLDEQLYVSAKLVLYFVEYLRSAQKHRKMGIMAAGVHDSVHCRSVFVARAFLYGQRVDVGAKAYRFAGLSPVDGGDYAVAVVEILDIGDADGLKLAIDTMAEMASDVEYDVVAGAESRGFIFGAPLAYNEGKPFVLIRKKGKLPAETVEMSYDLEYGQATIEMHKDSVKKGDRVLIVDDLIATGGTTEAMIKLVESLGAEVAAVVVLVELPDLKGREKIEGYKLYSAVRYMGE